MNVLKKYLAPFEISERKTSLCVLTLPHTARRDALRPHLQSNGILSLVPSL